MGCVGVSKETVVYLEISQLISRYTTVSLDTPTIHCVVENKVLTFWTLVLRQSNIDITSTKD